MKEKSDGTVNFFGNAQRKFVGFAITWAAIVGIIVSFFLVFLMLKEVTLTFNKVLWPLAIAGILSLLLRPVVLFMQQRLKWGLVPSIIALYIGVILLALGFLALLLPPIIEQSIHLFYFIPDLVQDLWNALKVRFPESFAFFDNLLGAESLKAHAEQIMQAAQSVLKSSFPALAQITGGVLGFFAWVTALAIIPVYGFYLLYAKKGPLSTLKAELSFIKGQWAADILFLAEEFLAILTAFFRGQFLIGLIMGALLAIGFTAVGLQFALVLGLVIGVLNIIPYLGTVLGLFMVLPVAFLQNEGGWGTLLLALLVFSVVQLIEGYILTPKIMGKQTGLHPMVIIVSIFFWGTAFGGLLGMILAVPLTAFLVVFWHLLKRKYQEA